MLSVAAEGSFPGPDGRGVTADTSWFEARPSVSETNYSLTIFSPRFHLQFPLGSKCSSLRPKPPGIMRQTVFINYVNGVHRNNWEQQRRIVSHASKQKRTSKKTVWLKPTHPGARDPSNWQPKDIRDSSDYLDSQDDYSFNASAAPFRGQVVRNPTCDNALSGLDPFGALPIRTDIAGVQDILQYCTSQVHCGFTVN